MPLPSSADVLGSSDTRYAGAFTHFLVGDENVISGLLSPVLVVPSSAPSAAPLTSVLGTGACVASTHSSSLMNNLATAHRCALASVSLSRGNDPSPSSPAPSASLPPGDRSLPSPFRLRSSASENICGARFFAIARTTSGRRKPPISRILYSCTSPQRVIVRSITSGRPNCFAKIGTLLKNPAGRFIKLLRAFFLVDEPAFFGGEEDEDDDPPAAPERAAAPPGPDGFAICRFSSSRKVTFSFSRYWFIPSLRCGCAGSRAGSSWVKLLLLACCMLPSRSSL
mmetsp:Transcript_14006/g.34652  ORF Transcript_14006/g.34652 Transcript_14006/m.34652 type:complete len:282 (-) Transcript_14006:725-1570(-)